MVKKHSNKASTAKIALIYTITNFITRGMSFLTTPFFSRLMSREEYGQFSNIASWVSILTVLATADLYSSISRAKYDFDKEIKQYLSGIMVLSNIITLILYGAIEANISFFENFFSMKAIYIRFIFIYLLFWPASQFLQKKSQVYSEYKSVVAISCISLFSSVLASATLILVMENKLLARVMGNYLVVALIDILLWAYILSKGRKVSKKHCVYALKISLPLIPHNLAANLLISSDRIIINKLCGAEDAALYSLAYTIAMIASLLLSSLNQAWVPWLFDRIYNNKNQIIRKNSAVYIGIFSFLSAGLMLAAPEIVLIFGGKEYYEARFVVAPVIMGTVLQFVYTLYVNIELYMKKTYLVSCGTVIATSINILLNYLCIPRWGYIAAAYTTLFGYLCMALFHYAVVVWKCNQYVDIYNKKAVILSVLLLSCMTVFCLIIYQHMWAGYFSLFIYIIFLAAVVHKKRAVIRQLFRK